VSPRIDLNQRDIVVRVRADVFRLVPRLIAKRHLDRLRVLHHVVVRQDVPVAVDQKSRPRAFHRHRIEKEIVLHRARHDVCHCRRSLAINFYVFRFGGIEPVRCGRGKVDWRARRSGR
jgi:hypothetical protein